MTFGDAIFELKDKKKVARKGWNGKGMYLYLHTFEGFLPCVVMVTAQGLHQPGWLASQPDILSDDWEIIGLC